MGGEFICISQTECKHPFIGCRAFLASQYHDHQLSYALPTRSGAACTKHVPPLFPPTAVPSKLLFAYPGSPIHRNSQNVIWDCTFSLSLSITLRTILSSLILSLMIPSNPQFNYQLMLAFPKPLGILASISLSNLIFTVPSNYIKLITLRSMLVFFSTSLKKSAIILIPQIY